VRLLPPLDLEDELRPRADVLRLRLAPEDLRLVEPLLRPDELRLRVPLEELLLRLPPDELRLRLDDERDEPDRPPLELFDEPDRLFVPDARDRELLDEPDLEPVREREDWLELLRLFLPPRPCSCPLSSSLLSSFLATAAAAGTATPSAAPAATFFPVDIPSFPSTSSIWTS
jgi:hypothetical protein